MILLLAAAACFPCVQPMAPATSLDPADPAAVFRHVFSQLPQETIIYPSENHYYFVFKGGREEIHGNLWLDVGARDRGQLTISYATYRGGGRYQAYGRTFGPRDLTLTRLQPLLYRATYESRTVRFRLHKLVARLPASMKLRPGEVYVGPSFDDSGLQFALVYFKRYRHFHWVLDQDRPVPDTLVPHGAYLLVGRTSKFVFYRDASQNRLILAGVSAKEAIGNSPFDGPFDQLPDNLIEAGEVDLLTPLSAYMDDPKSIDRFGRSVNSPAIRTSIQPYMTYEKLRDLDWVADCEKSRQPSSDEFYACLANAEER